MITITNISKGADYKKYEGIISLLLWKFIYKKMDIQD